MSNLIDDVIHVEDEFSQYPDHFSWIADLVTAWRVATNQIDSRQVDWNVDALNLAGIDDLSRGTFHYRSAIPSEDSPHLGIRAFCVKDGQAISGTFGTPILMATQASSLSDLLTYKIREINGEPIQFEKSTYLGQLLQDLDIPQHSPVFQTVFFLPVPLEGADYETHFAPMVTTMPYQAANYLIVEKNLVAVGQVTNRGHGRLLMGIDKKKNEFYHQAKFTPDARTDGKIFLPEYEGRMIVITKPVEVGRQLSPYIDGKDFRPVEYYDTQRPNEQQTPQLLTRSIASVDTVSIETGMQSNANSARVEAIQTFNHLPTIFDIRCLGVRRGMEGMYTPDNIKSLFKNVYSVPTIGK